MGQNQHHISENKNIASFAATSAPLSAIIAQSSTPIPPYNPLTSFTDMPGFIVKMGVIANWLGGVILGIAVIMIIYSAYNFLTAGGDETKVTTARSYLVYALVGIAVALLAFALPAFVRTFLV